MEEHKMGVERRQAEKTSFVFGREDPNTGSPITDRKQIVKRRYVVTSWNHDENSEKEQSDALRAGRADVFGEDGFLWGDGDIEIEIPSESGFLDIIQGVLADPTPVSVAIPDKTLVPASTDVSGIVAANYFSDTTDVTVKVIDAQKITDADAKTIAENLSAYREELTLTVAPDSDADLTSAATDGTIVITYTDAEGASQTLTLTFADASKTTAQMTKLPAGATVSEVESTGWSAGKFDITTAIAGNIVRNPDPDRPGQLRFEFSEANAGGQVIVRGVRKVGLASSDTLPMREVLKLSETGSETMDVMLEKYFHRINKVEIKDKDGADFSTGTVEITSRPGGYETTLKTVNDEFPGWTLEPEVGGEPWVVTKGVPIGAEIAIGDNIRATIDILSNRVDKRRTIEGGDEEQFQSTAAQHPDEFPFVGRRFFSAYGKYLEIDDEAVICDAAPISIAHNYDFSARAKYQGVSVDRTEPTARRNVTSSIQTKYESGTSEEDVFIRWDEKFRNNEPVSARIVTYQWLGNGKQLAIIYELPYCEITDPVRVAATGAGSIPITIALKAVPPPGKYRGRAHGKNHWRGPVAVSCQDAHLRQMLCGIRWAFGVFPAISPPILPEMHHF